MRAADAWRSRASLFLKTQLQRLGCDGAYAVEKPRGFSIGGCVIFSRCVEPRDAALLLINGRTEARYNQWAREQIVGRERSQRASHP